MSRLKRKHEHLISALHLAENYSNSGFADVSFVHNALPEIAASEVSTTVQLFGKTLETPLIINAITGGGIMPTKVNQALAVCARETGLAMAVGSQAVALESSRHETSFKVVRKVYPGGLIIANVSANQPVDQARRAIDMISADALQVHLNVPQETVMSEGDSDFSGWLKNISMLVRQVDIPLIVKEVGFGLSTEVVKRLRDVGVVNFDIGGRGGTNFIAIEGLRSTGKPISFGNWGISTAASLIEVNDTQAAAVIIAAGGITNGFEVAKSLALGADAAGIAGTCLRILFEKNVSGLIAGLETIKSDLKKVMLMLGVREPAGLRSVPVVVAGKTREWLHERGINTAKYAQRGLLQK